MAFDELQIKYEYIDYNDHSNIESFESDRHHSTHDDRIVCILKILYYSLYRKRFVQEQR